MCDGRNDSNSSPSSSRPQINIVNGNFFLVMMFPLFMAVNNIRFEPVGQFGVVEIIAYI